MTALLSLPLWIGLLVATVGTAALGVIPFILLRHSLASDVPEETRTAADTVALRVGALHGLILALVFAEAQATHADLRQEVSKEVTLIEHVAENLSRFGPGPSEASRAQLAGYVSAVLQQEWLDPPIPVGSAEARAALNDLTLGVLDLPGTTLRQQTLRDQLIDDLDQLEEHRKIRISLAHRSLPGLFWWTAIIGFALTVVLFFAYQASATSVAMLAAYGAYTGLVLYFILALGHPFVGPAAIDTSPYPRLLVAEAG